MSLSMARRAKARVLESHFSQFREKYALLHSYIKDLKFSNPGSTVNVKDIVD